MTFVVTTTEKSDFPTTQWFTVVSNRDGVVLASCYRVNVVADDDAAYFPEIVFEIVCPGTPTSIRVWHPELENGVVRNIRSTYHVVQGDKLSVSVPPILIKDFGKCSR